MDYLLISFSHKNTNIVDRDLISFQDDLKLEIFMNRTKSYLSEIMILNTCNRVEFFATSENIEKGIKNLLHDISQYSKVDIDKLKDISKISTKDSAIHHLFSVVSSIESIVVGETQIVGQIKDAFRFAFKNDFAGQKISRAIHYSFKCSALVRQNTAISKNKISIASVAVSEAENILGSLKDVKSLVIGSGEMSRLISQYLFSKGAKVTITNRTKEKATIIAKEIESDEIEVCDFKNIYKLINEKTIIFTATSSENSIIKKEMVKDVPFKRYWFDLAVPKDIDNCETELIKIFRVDDLQESVNRNIDERHDEVIASKKIIGESTQRFIQWTSSLSVEPIIKKIYLKGQDSVKNEVSIAIQKGYIPKNLQDNVEKIAEKSIKKLLHGMSKNLKNISHDSSVDTVIESMNYIFSLNQKDDLKDSYKCDYLLTESENLLNLNKKV